MRDKFHIDRAVIMAGGLGTRFLPATLAVAKELFPVGSDPIMLFHLEDLAKAGIKKVMIVGNKLKEKSIKEFLYPTDEYIEKIKADGKMKYLEKYYSVMNSFESVSYINQEVGSDIFNEKNGCFGEKRGSAIAVFACYNWAGEDPFIIVNGDDFCIFDDGKSVSAELIGVFNKIGGYEILGRKVAKDDIYKYSSMRFGKKIDELDAYFIEDIIEKPEKGKEYSDVMGFSRYIVEDDIFDKIVHSQPRKNGEYCLTDVFSGVAKEGRLASVVFDGVYYDCGSNVGLQLANNYILLKDDKNREIFLSEFDKLRNMYFSE